MNKLLISCLFVCSICFSQTGMMTKEGESGMGVHLSANLYNIEYDDADPSAAIAFRNMTSDGLEFVLSYTIENGVDGLDFNPITVGVLKHFKNDDGWNQAIGLQLYNITEAEAEDAFYYYDTEMQTIIGAGMYNNDNMYIELSHNLDADEDGTSMAIGSYMDMGGLILGFQYSANLSYLDEGWVGISIGSDF